MSKIIPATQAMKDRFLGDSLEVTEPAPGIDTDDHPNSHQNENYPAPHPVGIKPAPIMKDERGNMIEATGPGEKAKFAPGVASAANPMALGEKKVVKTDFLHTSPTGGN